jgi:hypothetical protein
MIIRCTTGNGFMVLSPFFNVPVYAGLSHKSKVGILDLGKRVNRWRNTVQRRHSIQVRDAELKWPQGTSDIMSDSPDQCCGSASPLTRTMRIRILPFNLMRIHADPDPQNWSRPKLSINLLIMFRIRMPGTSTVPYFLIR